MHGGEVGPRTWARYMDIPRKLEIRQFRTPNRTLFDMDSRVVVQWGSPECSLRKSTISVTDLSRRGTVGKLMTGKWSDPPSQTICCLLDINLSSNIVSAAWIFARELEIWIARAPNRALFDMDSSAGVQWAPPGSSGAAIDHFSNRLEP